MRDSVKLIPKRRFKGFADDWEQLKLLDFAYKAVDNRGKTPPLDSSGTHPLIEVASLGVGTPDYHKVEKYLNHYSFENNLRDYIKQGDILFSTVGSIGLVSLMDCREHAAIAQNIVAFRPIGNNRSEYLYALFSTKENKAKAHRIVMGAVQPSIKVSQLVDVEYALTTNDKEQELIGDFFSKLDNLISLQQRKLEKIKALKSAYLTEMFPAEGERVPKRRFAGFTYDWEQQKLEYIVDFSRGKGLSWNDIVDDGNHECVLYGHLYTNYGMVINNVNYYTNKHSNEMVFSYFGDVLIPSSDTTPTGLARAASIEKSAVILGSDINILRPKPPLVGSFLSYNINSNRNKLIKLIKGTTVKHLNNSDLKSVDIFIPKNPTEQEKISDMFKILDRLIAFHQRKLEKLQSMKKAYLNEMFV